MLTWWRHLFPRLTRQEAYAPLALLPLPPSAIDNKLADIVRRVQPFTMTSPQRIAALCRSIAYLETEGIQGDIVECGVWRGGSMMAVALTLLQLKATPRRLWLFDTFAGMTAPGPVDCDRNGRPALEFLRPAHPESSHYRAACAQEEVRRNLASTGYPMERVLFVAGPVEETLPVYALERIALLRLDTDWYESTRLELVHLFPHLVQGGVLIVDDYGHWQGARRAVDEYFAGVGLDGPLHAIDDTGRLAIKEAA